MSSSIEWAGRVSTFMVPYNRCTVHVHTYVSLWFKHLLPLLKRSATDFLAYLSQWNTFSEWKRWKNLDITYLNEKYFVFRSNVTLRMHIKIREKSFY